MSAIRCHCGSLRKVDQVTDGEYWYHPECHVCGCIRFATEHLNYDPPITCDRWHEGASTSSVTGYVIVPSHKSTDV
jgi:hypothetical protein